MNNMFDDSVLIEHQHRTDTPPPVVVQERYQGASDDHEAANGNATSGGGDGGGRVSNLSNLSSSFTQSGKPNTEKPSQKFESLDYDQCENMLQLEEESNINRFVFWVYIVG